MTFHVKHSGTWKQPEVSVKHGGTWKPALLYVRSGGVWTLVNVEVTISPTSQTHNSTSDSYVFGACVVTVTGAAATSYTWGFTSDSGGTFSIVSGAGTASAVPQVTGVAPLDFGIADFNCDVVVAGVTFTVTCSLSHNNA